ncbi:MAG: hypothetical protein NT154_25315 [Verrucomicrobia bacterium]|nr:hypothetical protein [Verrucomicrobiota bacterium]
MAFFEPVPEAGAVQAERMVVAGLKRMGWSEADLKARRKGEPRKVELAWQLRSQTTMPLAWIAERLNLGTRGHLAWLLQRRGQSRLTTPVGQYPLADPFKEPTPSQIALRARNRRRPGKGARISHSPRLRLGLRA